MNGTPEQVRAALLDLVALHDGPRNERYHAARDAAWARARDVLGVVAPQDAMVRVYPLPAETDVSTATGMARAFAASIRDHGMLAPLPGARTAAMVQAEDGWRVPSTRQDGELPVGDDL